MKINYALKNYALSITHYSILQVAELLGYIERMVQIFHLIPVAILTGILQTSTLLRSTGLTVLPCQIASIQARSKAQTYTFTINHDLCLAATGTYCTMLSSMLSVSTSTIVPAISHTSNGVSTGASSVEVAVIPTERARSPFAR